ncbi:Spy/CpxP family protein refolding chaperone [Jeongeupia wiesaeckerbachi]|uniref:Spy/CpxP family protein refolding chaperone n=1 Tax=Jeongeupia wiesaeckerbachi TaxID=3051218 RepID=UPI003D805D59
MKRNRRIVTSLIAALVLGTAATAAMADAPASAPAQARWGHHERLTPEQWQAKLDARLTRMAQKLQITPAQQGAWDAYAKTTRETFTQPPARQKQDGIAAAEQLRQRAAMMQEHAKRTLKMADATDTLAKSLTPAQNQTLDGMVKHFGPGKHRMPGAHGARPPAPADATL